MIKVCEKCNFKNVAKNFDHRPLRCGGCSCILDWRLVLICNECGTEKKVLHTNLSAARCSKCNTNLSLNNSPTHYKPNVISIKERLVFLALSIFMLGVSSYAIINKKIILPLNSKRNPLALFEFSGFEVILPIISFLLAFVGFISIVIDHYDKRQNEHIYNKLIKYCLGGALFVYIIALLFGKKIV